MPTIEGGCLCGNVRYESSSAPSMTAVCHCPDCQKQTGTSFSIVVGIPLDSLRVTGTPKVYTTTGESGSKVARQFCGDCGSPLLSVPDVIPGLGFLKAGTLDDPSWLRPNMEFFCDTAQPWVDLKGDWDRAPRNPPLG